MDTFRVITPPSTGPELDGFGLGAPGWSSAPASLLSLLGVERGAVRGTRAIRVTAGWGSPLHSLLQNLCHGAEVSPGYSEIHPGFLDLPQFFIGKGIN